jgi:hypothetical protein
MAFFSVLRTYWVLVVMDQFARRIVGFAVRRGVVDGMALCRMFNSAIHTQTLPRYRSSDHDPLYRFHQWRANLRVLEIQEIKTVPYVPLLQPFVERLIGTFVIHNKMQSVFRSAPRRTMIKVSPEVRAKTSTSTMRPSKDNGLMTFLRSL